MKYFKAVALISLIAVLVGCAPGRRLATKPLGDPASITGKYTLILYGGGYDRDLETLAILDRQGDSYEFLPYAPDYRINRTKDLETEAALAGAEGFLRSLVTTQGVAAHRIISEEGEVIGYEMRPLHFPLAYGERDVLMIDYRLLMEAPSPGMKGVRVYVRLKPWVDEHLKSRTNSDR